MTCFALINILAADDLTQGQKNVWQYLVFRANGAKVCWPKVADIASYLGMSDRNVMAATKKLVDTGRIRVTKRYKDTNNYHIIDLPGLHDKPDFGDQRQPAPPSDAPISDVKKTTVETHSEVQKTTQPDLLPCKNTHSEVKKPALPSIQQESNKEVSSLRSERARRIPDDWEPTELDRRYAIERGVDPQRAAEEFRNYWFNRTGRGSTMIDWSRAFQNRILALQDRGPLHGGFMMPQRSKLDQLHFEMGTRSLLIREYDDAGNEVATI